MSFNFHLSTDACIWLVAIIAALIGLSSGGFAAVIACVIWFFIAVVLVMNRLGLR